jgi:hypothetical protein
MCVREAELTKIAHVDIHICMRRIRHTSRTRAKGLYLKTRKKTRVYLLVQITIRSSCAFDADANYMSIRMQEAEFKSLLTYVLEDCVPMLASYYTNHYMQEAVTKDGSDSQVHACCVRSCM